MVDENQYKMPGSELLDGNNMVDDRPIGQNNRRSTQGKQQKTQTNNNRSSGAALKQ